jgi:hypothetical protein
MKAAPRRNALFVAVLALAFCWVFEFFKHDPRLRNVIPFGEDPYDAVSSFAAIAVVLLAVVSLARSYFPRWVGRSRELIYVLRTQAAVPFCVLVTVVAEGVAMVRHPSRWVGTTGAVWILTLEAALAAIAVAVLVSMSGDRLASRPAFARAVAIWLATLLALAVYPEQLILRTPGHLLTVVLGAVFLFAPVSALVRAWLPWPLEHSPEATSNRAHRKGKPRYVAFAAAAVIGLAIGAFAYLGEVSEDPVRPAASQMLLVGSVFLGLGCCGITIGYAFLGRLLGFDFREPPI